MKLVRKRPDIHLRSIHIHVHVVMDSLYSPAMDTQIQYYTASSEPCTKDTHRTTLYGDSLHYTYSRVTPL